MPLQKKRIFNTWYLFFYALVFMGINNTIDGYKEGQITGMNPILTALIPFVIWGIGSFLVYWFLCREPQLNKSRK